MFHNSLKIAAMSVGLLIISGSAASATPMGSASKAASVFDGSEAGVQLVHRRYVRRHFHGPSVSFGFGLHPYGYRGPRAGIHGPGFSFGLGVPHGYGHRGFYGRGGGFHGREGGKARGY